jgi:hypothetical protein
VDVLRGLGWLGERGVRHAWVRASQLVGGRRRGGSCKAGG